MIIYWALVGGVWTIVDRDPADKLQGYYEFRTADTTFYRSFGVNPQKRYDLHELPPLLQLAITLVG